MVDINGDKKVHLKDIIIDSTQAEYKKALVSNIISTIKTAPVIIVASKSYKLVESLLKCNENFTLHSMKSLKVNKVDSLIQERFTSKDKNSNYEVFLLSEYFGRGNDIPTTLDIEAYGGSHLILTDLFSSKSQ